MNAESLPANPNIAPADKGTAGDMMNAALREKMNGKDVLHHECKSVLTPSPAFAEKGLCTGYVLNFADSCCFSCPYCYVESEARRRIHETLNGRKHQDVVVLRTCDGQDGLAMLETNLKELAHHKKTAKEVFFTATHADPAANMEFVRKTAAGIIRICEETNGDVRILSKSNLLAELVKLVPKEYHQRMILGVSTGTLDDDLAKSIEVGAPLVSQRIKSLHWLQDNGFRTFGMICPNLPLEGDQEAYDKASREMCDAIRVDRCEHVWAEPINVRGDNMAATIEALRKAGYNAEADNVERIFADGNEAVWDDYAKATFTAHAKNIPPEKLRFLHYPTQESLPWWKENEKKGAVLLGEIAHPKPQKQAARNLEEALRKSIVPCTELANLNIPKREKVLGDWFLEGDLGFIFAQRGLGKTWLSLAIARAVASGTACGPWKANGARKTLYVDGEMPVEAIQERIQGMGADENLMVLNHETLFHFGNKTLNLADPATREALTKYLLAKAVKVLILDNLSCLFSGVKENEGDAWEPIKLWLLTLRRHRISVILIHHAGRNGEMRGTSKREDDVFWIIRLNETSNDLQDGAQFISEFTKDRNSQRDQAPIEWRFTTGANGKVKITHCHAASVEAFRHLVEAGETSASAIAEKLGVEKGTVSKWATKAVADGWLKKDGRKYALKKAA